MTVRGPDIAMVGAARCGTTFLAAQLAAHPAVDGGSVKESNYFSRSLDRGPEWYDGLYAPDTDLLRLDASVSYTYPQHPGALDELAAAAPGALCVYLIRDPVQRAISHFHYNRYYFENDDATTFSAALARDDWYVGVSDYQHWIENLDRHFGADRVLVVPFAVVRTSPEAVLAEICGRLEIDPAVDTTAATSLHRNAVVAHRSDLVRRLVGRVRSSKVYPAVRQTIGPDRLRRLRQLLVDADGLPTPDQAIADCDDEQRAALRTLSDRVGRFVTARLGDQDRAADLAWSAEWQADATPG
jgi:hypothetical protein